MGDGLYDFLLEKISKDVKKSECLLFLGSAIHAGPPKGSVYKYTEEQRPLLAAKLSELLASCCGFTEEFPDESIYNLQRVALYYDQTEVLGRNDLVDALRRYLSIGKKPSPILHMLAKMPFSIIVTTNYDSLIEKALQKHDKYPIIGIYDPAKDYLKPTKDYAGDTRDPRPDQPFLFKMHGDFTKPDSIVITEEDYITFLMRMTESSDKFHPIPQTIRHRISTWSTLFIGYSLRDYNLRLLFNALRWKLDESFFRDAYSVDIRPDKLIKKVMEEKKYIYFIEENIWDFVPKLYEKVMNKEYKEND